MGYIASNNIHAFPVASRGGSFPYSRLTTESNLTQNLLAFSTKDGFVVNPVNDISSATILYFVIRGYYFGASIANILGAVGSPSGDGTVYAKISVKSPIGATGIDVNEKLELEYSDDENGFTGVEFTAVSSGVNPGSLSDGEYRIPLFNYTNGSSVSIPNDYCYRLNSSDVELTWQSLIN